MDELDFDAAGRAHYGDAEWERMEAERAAAEAEDDDCRCCCCTGECRGTAPWQIEAEEREQRVLSAGFAEGDWPEG